MPNKAIIIQKRELQEIDLRALAAFEGVCRNFEIPAVPAIVLLICSQEGGETERSRIQHQLGISSVDLSRAIRYLDQNGLLYRIADHDKRKVIIALGEKGWDLSEALEGQLSSVQPPLPTADIIQNEGLLQKARASLSLTRAQALCLAAVGRGEGLLPSAQKPKASAIADLTGLKRTTARSALIAIQKRGLFSD